MPPVRRGRSRENANGENSSHNSTDDTASLRRQCAEKGLPSNGRRNTLISRLQQHAATNANSSSTSSQADEAGPQLSASQLAQIESIVTRSVEQSVAEIATNAARAAVQAMHNNSAPQNVAGDRAPVVSEEIEDGTGDFILQNTTNNAVQSDSPPNNVPYGNGFHEVPAAYVKKIQSGEFFDLSKLLSKNMSLDNQPQEDIILTLDNSVIKARKASQSTTKITNIEQWTTAFTTYMSVVTHMYPTRAQELLQYMSMIRHAAQTHPGLGWSIYDHKFRSKAAHNPSLNWAMIDQQLWLMIFTTSPHILAQQFPIFSNGPQRQASSGGERGGFCHQYNGKAHCFRQPCAYRHMCNKCNGPHPGCLCPSVQPQSVENEERTSKRDHKSSRSKHN